jgi:hypothetical protein
MAGDGVILTVGGHWFNVLDPDPSTIHIEDIAHALSNQCRFTGHLKRFYSVAQHSVLVSQVCDPEDAYYGLLHDGTEAYLSDIARPVKQHPELGPAYLAIEARLMSAIEERFGLQAGMPPSVKEADNTVLMAEANALMPDNWRVSFSNAAFTYDAAPVGIFPWMPIEARFNFVQRFRELGG